MTSDERTKAAARLICGDLIDENQRLRDALRSKERETLEAVLVALIDATDELPSIKVDFGFDQEEWQGDIVVVSREEAQGYIRETIAALTSEGETA